MKKKKPNPNEGYEPDPDQESRAEEAFTGPGSDTATLGKAKLRPYTPERVVAAQAMVRHYGHLDEAGVEQFNKTRKYPGMLHDIICHCWLRSLANDFDIDAAIRDPASARKEAYAWASKRGITDETGGAAFWDAWEIFMSAMKAIRDSRAEAEKKTTSKVRKTPLNRSG